ncbi:MAG: hypothetical protein N3F66_11200 [Spirochaetes bacterium]|nr:hypothetical protein [Spirochaetota bacterium]
MPHVYDTQFHYDQIINQFHIAETKIDGLRLFYNYRQKIVSWFNYDTPITVALFNLFDQLAYEIQEFPYNNDGYILDILYRKAETYLAFMKGLQYYENFLLINNLIYDDILIIWRHSLINLRERCINDFHEQKPLQYGITTALLTMPDETLIPFFYDIALSPDVDIAISAIVGLSLFRKKFANWKKLCKGDSHYDAMVTLASTRDIENYDYSNCNDNIYILFLCMRAAEIFAGKVRDILSLMNAVLRTIPENNILYLRSVEAIESLLYRLTRREFNHFTVDDIVNLIDVFNLLPAEIVDGVIQYWNIPKIDFLFTVQRAIHEKQIHLDDCSNIATLLCTVELD